MDGEKVLKVLRGVNLQLDYGESIAIMGPSGSGKTTLLMSIAGIMEFDDGNVLLEGLDISLLTFSQKARLRLEKMGIVFQFHYLLNDLNVLDNVVLPKIALGCSRREAYNEASYLLNAVGLYSKAHLFPSNLSGGEKQKVALCRALINAPKLLLADEPTGNLDKNNARVVLDLMMRLVDELKTSLLLVTHDRDVARVCGKILVLNDGMLRMSDV